MRPSPFNAGLMSDFKLSDKLAKQFAGESVEEQGLTYFLKRDEQGELVKNEEPVEELPEPIGGHRANLITFSIRAHINQLDTQPDFNSLLRKERAYNGIREISRAAIAGGRQFGKTSTQDQIRQFMGDWLNYIGQLNEASGNGRKSE